MSFRPILNTCVAHAITQNWRAARMWPHWSKQQPMHKNQSPQPASKIALERVSMCIQPAQKSHSRPSSSQKRQTQPARWKPGPRPIKIFSILCENVPWGTSPPEIIVTICCPLLSKCMRTNSRSEQTAPQAFWHHEYTHAVRTNAVANQQRKVSKLSKHAAGRLKTLKAYTRRIDLTLEEAPTKGPAPRPRSMFAFKQCAVEEGTFKPKKNYTEHSPEKHFPDLRPRDLE